jgi:hypothetical protein
MSSVLYAICVQNAARGTNPTNRVILDAIALRQNLLELGTLLFCVLRSLAFFWTYKGKGKSSYPSPRQEGVWLCRGDRGIVLIINLGARWKWVVNFMPRPLYRRKEFLTHWAWVDTRAGVGFFGAEKILVPTGFKHRTVQSVRGLVSIPTTVVRLLLKLYRMGIFYLSLILKSVRSTVINFNTCFTYGFRCFNSITQTYEALKTELTAVVMRTWSWILSWAWPNSKNRS